MPAPGVCMSIMNARQRKNGIGTTSNPEKYSNQDYLKIKQYCQIRMVRYIDEMFPPDRRTIGQGVLSPENMSRVKWLRPHKLTPNPCFTVGGISRFDFGQGSIGNCWFLASIGALTFQKFILEQVVPFEQNFDESYCGIFHFRFWRFGRWVDVVIDDKLPTIDGRLVFVHSKDPNEFWPALLEKAYAKVCGSYADMNAGTPAEALVDFTGGVHICVDLSKPPTDLWELMSRAAESKSLMGCGTPQGETSANTVLPNGLVQGHAYTVTGVRELMSRGQAVPLVRLLNPWGEGEWNGDWCDESSLWQTVSPQDQQMCLKKQDDGEFWMALEDFCKFYSDLDICCLCPDFLDGSSSCHWKTLYHEGRWVAGTTAGGCMNNLETFWTNPQYRVKTEKLSNECESEQNEKNMLVSLMQKPDKRNRRLVQNIHIGFSVFEVPEEYRNFTGKLPASFFNRSPAAQTASYMNSREVMMLVSLKPGDYVIVPSTFNANETASFIITILSKAEAHLHESSRDHEHTHKEEETSPMEIGGTDENRRMLFRQYSDKYEEVSAEQLKELLNEKVLQGDLKSGGFSLDACHSMVALMDTSVTGKLNESEMISLWQKVTKFKEIFYLTDVDKSGTLSLSELRNAVIATGTSVSDEMLNLLALRYGTSSMVLTLESFIMMVLRMECMSEIFNTMARDGKGMNLQQSEWMFMTMYS